VLTDFKIVWLFSFWPNIFIFCLFVNSLIYFSLIFIQHIKKISEEETKLTFYLDVKPYIVCTPGSNLVSLTSICLCSYFFNIFVHLYDYLRFSIITRKIDLFFSIYFITDKWMLPLLVPFASHRVFFFFFQNNWKFIK
jgi:hypothetical protein